MLQNKCDHIIGKLGFKPIDFLVNTLILVCNFIIEEFTVEFVNEIRRHGFSRGTWGKNKMFEIFC